MGLESLHTRDVRHTPRLLIRHILALRAIPMFSTAMLVLIFESNLAFEAQHLLHAVQNYRDTNSGRGITNWVSLSEGQQQCLGWLTTNERKEQMCLLVREALTVGKIAYHPDFVSTELDPHKAKRQLQDELSSYCVMVEPPKTTFGKIRKTYTGKVHGKQDDLVIALQLAAIGCQKFFQDPRYRNFRGDDWRVPRGLV